MIIDTLVIRAEYQTTFITFPQMNVNATALQEIVEKHDPDGYSNLFKEVFHSPPEEWWRIFLNNGEVEREIDDGYSHAGHSWRQHHASSLEEAIEYYFSDF